ncbi:MAG: hypothetical protein IH951_11800 [Bacteroidetes bacterium]|nr:hypothetical protein [Bacteroidota bacterium]
MSQKKYVKRYGKTFDADSSESDIQLYAYAHIARTPEEKAWHLERAIKTLWPEKMPNGDTGYVWSEWDNRGVDSWCGVTAKRLGAEMDWATWWGPAASGKTTRAAVIVLADWLADPKHTATTVCSTSRDKLRERIFGEISRFYQMLDNPPGRLIPSKDVITMDDENSKNRILGIAVRRGMSAEAIGNIIGVHNVRNRMVIDEMQATPEAAVDATDNLSTGRSFIFLGMGNPVSRLDVLGRYSEPTIGWDKIAADTHEDWKTKFGVCLFYDGRKSPGVADPERFHFLLTTARIEQLAKRRGRNSIAFWSQRVGFVPPEGLIEAVLSESYIVKFHLRNPAIWLNQYVDIGGFDPAYATGGDRAALTHMRLGLAEGGIQTIEFQETHYILLERRANSKSADKTDLEPLTFSLAADTKILCNQLGILPENLGVDCSATQMAFADILDDTFREAGSPIKPHVHRVYFQGSASTLPVSAEHPKLGNEEYDNRVTELYFQIQEFARANMLRGMSNEALLQFCNRFIVTDPTKHRPGLIRIENKKDYKGRTGESPDDADSYVCGLDVVRIKHGVGAGKQSPALEQKRRQVVLQQKDLDSDPQNYLQDAETMTYKDCQDPQLIVTVHE